MRYSDCNGDIYVVQPGDTLYSISRRYNIPLAFLLRANPDVDIYRLYVGMEICIPNINPYIDIIPIRPFPVVIPPPRPPRPVPPPMPPRPPRPPRPPMEPGPVRPPRPPMEPGPVRPPRPMPQPRMDRQSLSEDKVDNSYVVINYVVKQNESMQDVLDRFGLKLSDVARFNRLDEIVLKPGTILKIPNTNAMDQNKYEE